MNSRLRAACNPIGQINVTYVISTGADLTWNAISGVGGYQVSVNTVPTPNVNQFTFFSVFPNYTISALDCNVKYYVFVRVICAVGDTSAWKMDSLTTTDCCKPPTPITYNPIGKNSIVVNLTSVQNVQVYEYDVSTNLKPSPQPSNNTTNTSIMLQGLQPYTEYLVCTRTKCAIGDPISVWKCDTVRTAPPCDSIKSVSKTNLGNNDYLFSWPAEPFALSYEYSISTDAQPPMSGNSTQNTQVNTNNLLSNTLYHFCVRAVCGSGYKTSWTCDTLKTPPGLNVASLKRTDVSIHPNPARSFIVITRPNSLTKGTVSIINLLGKIISRQELTGRESRIDVADIPPGVYFVWYSDTNQSRRYKVVIE